MTEEFRFEQRLGNRAAVHRDEGAGGAGAGQMNGSGQKLLAGAAFTKEQDARFALRHQLETPE